MKKIYDVCRLGIIALILVLFSGGLRYYNMKSQIAQLKRNQLVLLDSVRHYVVQDSLNALKTSALTLSLSEYKKYRAEDLALIKKLKADKTTGIIATNTETVTQIKTEIKDTVIYLDTLKSISYHSKWTDVEGFIKTDSAILVVKNREELLIHESIRRKKFLFFKLPIKLFGYKSQELDIVSKNPNTKIEHVEWIKVK